MSSIGYIAAFVAVVLYGSNFVPVKYVNTGDGIMFQFIMCSAIWMVGLVVQMIQHSPKFYPVATVGGIIWVIGNTLTFTIIKMIGLSLGILIWGSVCMLLGWATGKFGLFGLSKNDIRDNGLNYAGVMICFFGLLIFLNVKPNNMSNSEKMAVDSEFITSDSNQIEARLLDESGSRSNDNSNTNNEFSINKSAKHEIEDETFYSNWPQSKKIFVGFILAAVSGICFGCCFDLSQYIIDHHYDGDYDPINLVFTHFSGILFGSYIFACAYCLYKYVNKKTPYMTASMFGPAVICGTMWGIACACQFIANGGLGFSVAFPIIASGPGCVASLWGVFKFNEISGQKNYTILGSAIAVTFVGIICISLS